MSPTHPPSAVTSLWILANEAEETDFIAEIGRLAARHGTPVFHPHLTLLGDIPADPATSSERVRALATAAPAFTVPVEDIVMTDAFYRSFYAGFPLPSALQALRTAAIREFSLDPGPFTPHVSLLYGPVPPDAKAASAAEVAQRWKGRAVRFDRLAITNSGNDVPISDWRCLLTIPLGS